MKNRTNNQRKQIDRNIRCFIKKGATVGAAVANSLKKPMRKCKKGKA